MFLAPLLMVAMISAFVFWLELRQSNKDLLAARAAYHDLWHRYDAVTHERDGLLEQLREIARHNP